MTKSSPGTADGLIFVTAPNSHIFDNRGEPVWWQPLPHGVPYAANLRVQQYRGRPVLTWWQGKVLLPLGYGLGEFVMVDQSYKEIARFGAGHGLPGDLHELLLDADGNAWVTAYEEVPADLRPVGGPAKGSILDCVVRQIDPITHDVLFEWRANGKVPFSESKKPLPQSGPHDYIHVNSIAFEPNGDLLLSARNTWAVYRVDPRTGAVTVRIGGRASNYHQPDGTTFFWQHDAKRRPDQTLTLFDDGASPTEEKQSRGLVLRQNPATKALELVKEYTHPAGLLAVAEGNLQTLPNSNVLIGWGTQPYVTEFDADGTLLFDAHMAYNQGSYRAFRTPWHATPAEPPAIAASRSGGSVNAYASWNGATEVASWRLLGGPSAGSLTTLTTVPRSGFETVLQASTKDAMVAVEPLDASGKPLSRSRTVTL